LFSGSPFPKLSEKCEPGESSPEKLLLNECRVIDLKSRSRWVIY